MNYDSYLSSRPGACAWCGIWCGGGAAWESSATLRARRTVVAPEMTEGGTE